MMPNGQVKNYSSRDLWVVSLDKGRAIAHRLAPSSQSPSRIDVDSFRAVDGTPVDGHAAWVKILDVLAAEVEDADHELRRGCFLYKNVGDDEFGDVVFDDSPDWGEPLQEAGDRCQCDLLPA
jgi:hypothetical protein